METKKFLYFLGAHCARGRVFYKQIAAGCIGRTVDGDSRGWWCLEQ